MMQSLLTRFFLAFLFLASLSGYAQANPRYASIIIDADSGELISARYADKRLHPASLTKIMTLMMTFEAIDSGKLSKHSRITMSRHAASMVPSKLNIPVGSSIQVEDAIKALVTKSANDVAVALAEAVGGSESNFARLMTNRAREIGMRNTTFKNASGLHHREQITTARDMAKLARYLIKVHPNDYQYFSLNTFRYKGNTFSNHNHLMKRYPGMDGLKTGYIGPSGFNLVASAVQNNRRLIGVVFGGQTASSRDAHMEALLNASFGKFKMARIPSQKPAPKPAMKPYLNQNVATAADVAKNPALILGEGDYEEPKANRYETGLIAAAVHTDKVKQMDGIGRFDPDTLNIDTPAENMQIASLGAMAAGQPSWSVQVGAFNSRLISDRAVQNAQQLLVNSGYTQVQPRILPTQKTPQDAGDETIVFRARLSGFDENQARKACAMLKECIVISPENYNR
jgi:D-alanyl-D-alanine carboxypeptidase